MRDRPSSKKFRYLALETLFERTPFAAEVWNYDFGPMVSPIVKSIPSTWDITGDTVRFHIEYESGQTIPDWNEHGQSPGVPLSEMSVWIDDEVPFNIMSDDTSQFITISPSGSELWFMGFSEPKDVLDKFGHEVRGHRFFHGIFIEPQEPFTSPVAPTLSEISSVGIKRLQYVGAETPTDAFGFGIVSNIPIPDKKLEINKKENGDVQIDVTTDFGAIGSTIVVTAHLEDSQGNNVGTVATFTAPVDRIHQSNTFTLYAESLKDAHLLAARLVASVERSPMEVERTLDNNSSSIAIGQQNIAILVPGYILPTDNLIDFQNKYRVEFSSQVKGALAESLPAGQNIEVVPLFWPSDKGWNLAAGISFLRLADQVLSQRASPITNPIDSILDRIYRDYILNASETVRRESRHASSLLVGMIKNRLASPELSAHSDRVWLIGHGRGAEVVSRAGRQMKSLLGIQDSFKLIYLDGFGKDWSGVAEELGTLIPQSQNPYDSNVTVQSGLNVNLTEPGRMSELIENVLADLAGRIPSEFFSSRYFRKAIGADPAIWKAPIRSEMMNSMVAGTNGPSNHMNINNLVMGNSRVPGLLEDLLSLPEGEGQKLVQGLFVLGGDPNSIQARIDELGQR